MRRLARRITRWESAIGDLVAKATEDGTDVREVAALVVLWERAMDRSASFLVAVQKLGDTWYSGARIPDEWVDAEIARLRAEIGDGGEVAA